MILVAMGARPNFVKLAPVVLEMRKRGLRFKLIHTTQHYDDTMTRQMWYDLEMPVPDVVLGKYSFAGTLAKFQAICEKELPELVLVAGDVDSTLACALGAMRAGIPIAHLEAGLRSFDRTMPEELNRVLVDEISAHLFVTEQSAVNNLEYERVKGDVHWTGNTMVDSLFRHFDKAIDKETHRKLGFQGGDYGLVTLHRGFNVDDPTRLATILHVLEDVHSRFAPLVFPVHPRARRNMIDSALHCIEPQAYHDFICLLANAAFVITDSGGVQEEATMLDIPCFTLRPNTERPVTVEKGTNTLVNVDTLSLYVSRRKKAKLPIFLWDGCAAQRVVDTLETITGKVLARW